MITIECTAAIVLDSETSKPKTTVTCSQCGYTTESWGNTEKSMKRSCWLLSQPEHDCPDADPDERYFYQVSEENVTDNQNVAKEESDEIPF